MRELEMPDQQFHPARPEPRHVLHAAAHRIEMHAHPVVGSRIHPLARELRCFAGIGIQHIHELEGDGGDRPGSGG
jgi:hypothetical protein